MSEAERKAKALLAREGLEEKSYNQLRNSKFTGFTDFYLDKKKKVATLSTDANLDTLLDFARLDITLGTTIAELVYSCCHWAPIKSWLETVINLDTVTPRDDLIEQVLTYKNDSGRNCLMAAFEMPTRYWNDTTTYPDSSHQLMSGAEKMFLTGQALYPVRLPISPGEEAHPHRARGGDAGRADAAQRRDDGGRLPEPERRRRGRDHQRRGDRDAAHERRELHGGAGVDLRRARGARVRRQRALTSAIAVFE